MNRLIILLLLLAPITVFGKEYDQLSGEELYKIAREYEIGKSKGSGDEMRKYLYMAANKGNTKAQNRLTTVYGHYMSPRINEKKARFWRCQAALKNDYQALINIERFEGWREKCPKLIEEGKAKGFHIYVASGKKVRIVEISKDYDYTVPTERIWRIEWDPQECNRVCKSDIELSGGVYIDSDKKYMVRGRNFTIDLMKNREGVIWIQPRTKFRVVGGVDTLQVTEFVE